MKIQINLRKKVKFLGKLKKKRKGKHPQVVPNSKIIADMLVKVYGNNYYVHR